MGGSEEVDNNESLGKEIVLQYHIVIEGGVCTIEESNEVSFKYNGCSLYDIMAMDTGVVLAGTLRSPDQ